MDNSPPPREESDDAAKQPDAASTHTTPYVTMEGQTGQQHVAMYRQACVECQRRKQRCSRVWPCNHCMKRKIADQCRFNNQHGDKQQLAPPAPQPQEVQRKRPRAHEDGSAHLGGAADDGGEADGLAFESLGYMAGPLLASLGVEITNKKRPDDVDWVYLNNCHQLQLALAMLPQRPQMDALVHSFFNNANYHYYIIYPPVFLQEYQNWWDRLTNQQPVMLQWTCLLIMVCACATQHLDPGVKSMVEFGLGESADVLTEKFHNVARELAATIPSNHYHLLNVQRMLHSIYWYKAEARFVEAWHDIGLAVREAQELGLHREAASESLPEFEREMRRRVWCILDTWDWQFASGLCRPTIIDHTDVDVQQPTLTLETISPSPLLHMKLQSQAIAFLAARFAAPKNVVTISDIHEYMSMLEGWIRSFPTVYATDNPDTSSDGIHPWIIHHRYYIHTMAYLMILNPMRTYMAKPYTRDASEDEINLRDDGVYYCLRNMQTTSAWTEHVSHKDGRFHFIIFSLFDTAAVLCTAIIKDLEGTIPRRQEILDAIDNAVILLSRLNEISKTAKTSYEILVRLARRVPRPPIVYGAPKRYKVDHQGSSPLYHDNRSPATMSPATTRSASVGATTTASTPMSSVPSEGYGSPGISEGASPGMGASPGIVASSGTDSFRGASHSPAYSGSYPAGPAQPHPVVVANPPPLPATIIEAPAQPLVMHPAGLQTAALPHRAPVVQGVPQPLVYAPPATIPEEEPVQEYGFDKVTDEQLGEFAALWNWQSLGLDFISSERMGGG